jgi:nitrogen fixation/metabolism regulation signal transduction histidine kinase
MTLSSLGSHSQTILKDNYRSVLAAQRMKDALERLEDQSAVLLLTEKHEGVLSQMAQHRQQLETELAVQEGNITEPGEAELTKRLRALWIRYQEKLATLAIRQDTKEAEAFYFAELEPAFYEVKTAADEILAKNQDAMLHKSDRVRRTAEQMSTLMIAAASGSLIVGLWLSIMLTHRLLRPLSVLRQTTQQLGEGDFAVRANVQGTDELAQLARDFNAMASRLTEYRNSSLGELLQAQQASQAAIDSLPDPVVVFGVAGDVRTVNQATETLVGLVLEPEMEKDPLSKVEPAVRSTLEKLRTHVLSGKGP